MLSELEIEDQDGYEIQSCIVSKNYSGSDFLEDDLAVFNNIIHRLNHTMKALKADNKYGYKVLYRENSRGVYIRYFMTYTLNQAVYAKRYYVQYPQRSRIDNKEISEKRFDTFF